MASDVVKAATLKTKVWTFEAKATGLEAKGFMLTASKQYMYAVHVTAWQDRWWTKFWLPLLR